MHYAWTRATYRVGGLEIFSIRTEAGGENVIEEGDRIPLVPDHVTSISGSWAVTSRVNVGAQARWTGKRYLRGDEANETEPLDGYWVFGARAGLELGPWGLQVVATNIFDAEYATFGTWNINQGAGGVVERFLTPAAPRSVQFEVRRRL
jgi:outer membrane receptor for monomeric catechols